MNYQNLIRDFAIRTKQNLKVIDEISMTSGSEVFEVTQLINSMLGLLVFPQQTYVNRIPRISLSQLVDLGWPIPRVCGDFKQVKDLNELIRYLRNAVSHFNIRFVEDDRGDISLLRVWNMRPVKDELGKVVRDVSGDVIEIKNWEAELGVHELRGIANKFIDLLIMKNDA